MRKSIYITIASILVFVTYASATEPLHIPSPEEYRLVKRSSMDFKEIKGVFDRIISAAKKGDLDAIVDNFSDRYLNSGRDKRDVRKQWKQIMENFTDLELHHPIYHIEKAGRFAKMKCEGVLLGKPTKHFPGEVSGEAVVIDSWKFSVHYLIKEDGRWKILGDQIPYDTGRTFHPLF